MYPRIPWDPRSTLCETHAYGFARRSCEQVRASNRTTVGTPRFKEPKDPLPYSQTVAVRCLCLRGRRILTPYLKHNPH